MAKLRSSTGGSENQFPCFPRVCEVTNDDVFQRSKEEKTIRDTSSLDINNIRLSRQNSSCSCRNPAILDEKEKTPSISDIHEITKRFNSKVALEQSSRISSTSHEEVKESKDSPMSSSSATGVADSRNDAIARTGEIKCGCSQLYKTYGHTRDGLQAQLDEAIADADRLSRINERQRLYLTEQRSKMSEVVKELQELRDKNATLTCRIKVLEQQVSKNTARKSVQTPQWRLSQYPQSETVSTLERELKQATRQNRILKEQSMAMEAANIEVSAEVSRLNRTIYLMKRRMSYPTKPTPHRFGFRPSITPEGRRRRPLPMTGFDRRPSVSPLSPVSDSSSSSIPRRGTLTKISKLRMRHTSPKE